MILTVTLNAAIDKRLVTKSARPGEVNRVQSCEYTPGGKGLNVSKVLALSGADILAGGFVGGFAGKYIEAELHKAGISSDFYHVAGESRSCINIWDEGKKQQTEYLEPGFTVSEEELHGFLEKYRQQMKDAAVISISGSVPRGVPSDIYQELIKLAHHAGKKVILDSSGELLTLGLKEKPTLVKPNIDEIRMLTNQDCSDWKSLIKAAEQIHQEQIPYVVISLGGDGALLVSEEGVFQAVIPKIQAVNTVGCGDAMVAGFSIGLEQGAASEELLGKASAISTSSAMSEYTGHYEKHNLDKLYHEIEIKKLK